MTFVCMNSGTVKSEKERREGRRSLDVCFSGDDGTVVVILKRERRHVEEKCVNIQIRRGVCVAFGWGLLKRFN